MNNLIYIQAQGATTIIQAPLCKDGCWRMKFGHNRTFEANERLERKYCTFVYTPYHCNNGEAARWIQGNHYDLAPDEIDEFVAKFKEAHPLTKVTDLQVETLLATDDEGYCRIESPYFRNAIKLTAKQERELVEMLKFNRIPADFPVSVAYRTGINALEVYFEWYCKHYGIEAKYKKYEKTKNYELAYQFCLIHGFNEGWLSQATLSCARTLNDLNPEDREAPGWFGKSLTYGNGLKGLELALGVGWIAWLIGLAYLIIITFLTITK